MNNYLFKAKRISSRPTPPNLYRSSVLEKNDTTGPGEEKPYGYGKYQFVASHFDELSMEPKDLIMLEKKVDDQWIYATNKRTGQKGIVPLIYIDVKIPLPTIRASIPQVPFYARALYDFVTGIEGDLTFYTNDEIYVTERISNDWLRGNIGMRQGIFPSNYIQEISSNTTAIPALDSVNLNEKHEFVIAAYDYESTIDEDLIFRAGDQIEVLEWVSSDWLRGKLNGKIGLVPRTYILTADNESAISGMQQKIINTIVTATKDYFSVANDHLCFSKHDRIEVIEEVNGEWLKGKLLLNLSNTKSFPVGLFPRAAIM